MCMYKLYDFFKTVFSLNKYVVIKTGFTTYMAAAFILEGRIYCYLGNV